MLHRLLAVAILAGALAGLLTTVLQEMWASPLILHAETFESAARPGEAQSQVLPHGHGHAGHQHGEAWAPADGLERATWTAAANIGLGIGAALVICAVLLYRQGASYRSGLLLGLVGYLAFSVAPSLGLPPELPGTLVAEIGDLRRFARALDCNTQGLRAQRLPAR